MTTLANTLAIAFVLHFAWSYYRNCYRKGYTMDVWHFFLLTNLFVIHVMLPFSRSDLNVLALGGLLKRTQSHVDEAYLISALGYGFLVLGGSLWRLNLGFGLREAFSRAVEFPTRASYFLLSSRPLLIANGIIALLMMTVVLLFYFANSGFGFNLRGLLIVTPWLRPIAQFAAFYATLIGSYCIARFYQYKERSMLLLFLLIVVGFLFYGERSNIAALPTLLVTVLFLQLGRRLKLWWIATGIAGAFFLAFFLNVLREPNLSLSTSFAGFLLGILFGNSFSDTRDFALVLSFWDGHLLLGKTYLAGLFAFIPRFLSSFRDTWAIGVVTATMAGFSPREHPGLRVGVFGEAYLNFGVVGVAGLGLFAGAIVRLMDSRMKQVLRTLPASDMRAYSYAIVGSFIGISANSSNASSFYTVLMILFASQLAWRSLRFLKLVY